MNCASTSEMIVDVAALIQILSGVIMLEKGDVIVTGTPAGDGLARKPPVFMRHGDICEVELQQLGILRNTIRRQRPWTFQALRTSVALSPTTVSKEWTKWNHG
jgi:2-keto-4-pentenoate hydratase/2-oxohepta-3-ene-1,7-dioic acid hydratase in catechol pathway